MGIALALRGYLQAKTGFRAFNFRAVTDQLIGSSHGRVGFSHAGFTQTRIIFTCGYSMKNPTGENTEVYHVQKYAGFLVGGLIAGTVALLAPQSGEETRREIRECHGSQKKPAWLEDAKGRGSTVGEVVGRHTNAR
jgi:hypothetical protein